MKIKRMTSISIFAALICISTVILPAIPIFGIPVTLQTFMIMVTALLLKPIDAFLAVMIYILMGVMGLPVFSGFKSGFDTILGPTGGFIVSFPFAAYFISLFKGNFNILRLLIVNFLFGIIFVYLIGAAFMAFYSKANYFLTLKNVLVFIPIDCIKAVLASFIAIKVRKFQEKY